MVSGSDSGGGIGSGLAVAAIVRSGIGRESVALVVVVVVDQ